MQSLINVLSDVTCKNSLGLNFEKDDVGSFTADHIFLLMKDMKILEERIPYLDGIAKYRIKSIETIMEKLCLFSEAHSLFGVFKDIIALRLIVEEYPDIPEDIPSVIVDNNGYRAMHVYYCESGAHYPVEIQYWLYEDVMFNNLSRKYLYKTRNVWYGKHLRTLYDEGHIANEKEFLVQMLKYSEEVEKEKEGRA